MHCIPVLFYHQLNNFSFTKAPAVNISSLLRTSITCLALCMAGCGGEDTGYSGSMGTLTGKVTVGGNPAPAGCTVSIMSAEQGFVATASTGADGTYSMTWKGSGDLPVGKYGVSVTGPAAQTETDPDKLMKMSQEGTLPEIKEVVPAKYQTAKTSGLSVEIKEGPNTYDIPIE